MEPDMVALEQLVDKWGLSGVVSRLATIAKEKAEHVRTNWQDAITANPWDKAATTLEYASQKIEV